MYVIGDCRVEWSKSDSVEQVSSFSMWNPEGDTEVQGNY